MTLRHIVDLVLAGAVLVVFIMVLATAGRLAVLAKQLEAKGKRLESLPLIARLEAAKADGERLSALPAQAAPIFARAQVAIQTLNRAIPRRAIRIAMTLAGNKTNRTKQDVQKGDIVLLQAQG